MTSDYTGLREAVSAVRHHDAGSKGAPAITEHGRLEIFNGICLVGFRKLLGAEALGDALASFEEDLTDGRYRAADVLWRATIRRAADVSREHTRTLGGRTLDVLHVAALVLGIALLRDPRLPPAGAGPCCRVANDFAETVDAWSD